MIRAAAAIAATLVFKVAKYYSLSPNIRAE
jgi:hypothetical protein